MYANFTKFDHMLISLDREFKKNERRKRGLPHRHPLWLGKIAVFIKVPTDLILKKKLRFLVHDSIYVS